MPTVILALSIPSLDEDHAVFAEVELVIRSGVGGGAAVPGAASAASTVREGQWNLPPQTGSDSVVRIQRIEIS